MTRDEAKALKWVILDLKDKQAVRLFENEDTRYGCPISECKYFKDG